MLDQYILGQLKINQDKYNILAKKLLKLQEEEESYNKMIENLLNEEDVGIEVFSPRSSNDSTRTKISRIKSQLEDIRLEEEKLRDEIIEIQKDEQRYQNMLVEIHEKDHLLEQDSNQEKTRDMNDSDDKEELKKILLRLDKCLNLLSSNRTQCKNEMINLKYYLKALIASK